MQTYVDKAGASEFGDANRLAELLPDIDSTLAELGDDHLAFSVLASINSAAESGAWTSQTLRSARFGSTPALREKAIRYADEHEAEADKLLDELYASMSAAKFVEQHLTPPKQVADEHGNEPQDDTPCHPT